MTAEELAEAMNQPEPNHVPRIVQKGLGQELANAIPQARIRSNFRLHDPRHHDDPKSVFYLDIAARDTSQENVVRHAVVRHARVIIEEEKIRILHGGAGPTYQLNHPNSIIGTVSYLKRFFCKPAYIPHKKGLENAWEEVFKADPI